MELHIFGLYSIDDGFIKGGDVPVHLIIDNEIILLCI
jgi:hypothetical protein